MSRLRGDLGFAALAGLASFVGAAWVLRIWDGDLTQPLGYYGDINLQHLLVRIVQDRGWYFEQPALGAPGGLELYDYPVLNGDTLHAVVLWLLGVVGFGSAAAMNTLYLASFPLVGIAAYLALRALGASPWPSLVCAVLYALLPYHFIRGEGHLFLATYYAAPVGAFLAVAVLDGIRLRIGVAVALAVFVGLASGSFYYAAFTFVLVVVATILRYVVVRDRRALVTGGVVAGVVLAVALLQLAPTLVYRAVNGSNDKVAQRHTFESEVYSLRMTQLVLPLDDHRIDALGRLKRRYTEKFPPIDANAATLGVVGTAGLVWLVVVVLGAVVGRRAGGRHPALAALTLVSVMLATTGGVGVLIGVLFPHIRAWNRLSIFIAFFALAAVALGLDALRRRVPPVAWGAVLAAVLAIGLWDQTTDSFVPPYGIIDSEWTADAEFYGSVESRLPDDASVVILPYEEFPEPLPGRQAVYEPVKAYLHTDSLRWSWGAMQGREDWAGENAERPPAELVPAAREAGFAAIVADRLGYPSDADADTAQAELTRLLGQPERSRNGRYLFWRL